MLLYLHVPFCRRRCPYCGFHSSAPADEGRLAAWAQAIREELALWGARPLPADPPARPKEAPAAARAFGEVPVETVFFGGGTPSLLAPSQVAGIIAEIRRRFPLAADAEITLEGNPDSLKEPGRLEGLAAAGINRLSMGAQSLDDRELALLGRLHSAADVATTVALARRAGFQNLGLDLMWALPGQDCRAWLSTLSAALDLAPDHVSAYALTLEEGTAFARRAAEGALPALPGEEEAAAMFLEGGKLLAARGLARYEISNFARPGRHCHHNLGYWQGRDYLGLGPSAVSTVGNRRWTDTPDLGTWIREVREGRPGHDAATLDAATRLRELVMLSLRTVAGLPLDIYRKKAGRPFGEAASPTGELATGLVAAGLATLDSRTLALTERGLLVSNEVIAGLFERMDEEGVPLTDPGRP